MRTLTLAFAAVVLGLLAACNSGTSELEDRVATLEAQVAELTADSSVPEILVTRSYHSRGTNLASSRDDLFCIEYLVAGLARTNCYEDENEQCYQDATVGEALPETCR